jgi:5-formyltetrahydrofolate cyclo-ligase
MAPTCESGPRGFVNADGRGGSIRFPWPSMSPETIDGEKAALRKIVRARRAALSLEARAAASLAVRDRLIGWIQSIGLAPDGAISGYWPIRDELDPRPAMQALSELGYRLALPVSLVPGEPLAFRAWVEGDALAPDIMRIAAPLPSAAAVTPALLLVPMLAFDRACRRLGYGAGFYDRTLASLRRTRATLALGLAFSVQEVERVPAGPDDASLDAVVTEDEVVVADSSVLPLSNRPSNSS